VKTEKKTTENKKTNCHSGHRARMRKKFFSSPAESFADHEILEMFLYGVFRQKDTNEIAHKLLSHFGSLKGVLDASPEELSSVPMIGEQSVLHIRLTTELMRRYFAEGVEKEKFDSIEKVGEFFAAKYIGTDVETVYALLLDNSLKFIDSKMIYEGSVNSARFDLNKIYRYAFSKNASNVIVAHNHPGGIAIPSGDDKATTYNLITGLSNLGINLIEHFIVAGERYMPIMRNSEDLAVRKISEDTLSFEKIEYMTGKNELLGKIL